MKASFLGGSHPGGIAGATAPSVLVSDANHRQAYLSGTCVHGDNDALCSSCNWGNL